MAEYTTSQLACFKGCPKKWFYRFYLMLDPIHTKRSLELGSYVHHLLAEFYHPNSGDSAIDDIEAYNTPERVTMFNIQAVATERYDKILVASEKYFQEKTKDLFEEEIPQFVEIREEAEAIITRYIEQNAEDLAKYRVMDIEKEFCVPVYNNNGKRTRDVLRGKFDMIVEDLFTTIWFWEHKTTSDSVDNRFDTIDLEEQLNNYILVASTLYGDDFGGGILNVIRKKAPRIPEPLKNGKGLSKDKKIDTTYDLYMEAIKQYGFNPADYTEILGILREKGDRFFGRKIVSRKPYQILETRDEIYFTIQAIRNLTNLYKKTNNPVVFYRTSTFRCPDCQYCNLCILDSKKGDVKNYIAGNFIKREVMNPELSLETVDSSSGMLKQ